MDELLPYLLVLGALVLVMGAFTGLARLIRRRGGAGGGLGAALAAYEEAFRATSHASHYEIRAQAERKDPLESPDRLRRGVRRGR
ncbi:hypothetical protein [Streptomyces cylindrosporus]|uniref:Secreted protein n=1 Tax=Streptomyces cylindrosporus TaxID=2927583 RepID=A0ABS9YF16_9ACTN|nr:hypothetical protein [Streptomyces cylindrosporus]MCI3275817.1 hypothetical protein [Streptomyces cylindrosporus]